MIIHHQTGKKASIMGLKKTVRTERGSILMCYDDPITKAKGIVEFTPNEVASFIAALSTEKAINDLELFRAFCGIKPHGH